MNFDILVLDFLRQLFVELSLGVHGFFAASIGACDLLKLGDEVDSILMHTRLTVVSAVLAFGNK